mgnify:CR=1 FL=1
MSVLSPRTSHRSLQAGLDAVARKGLGTGSTKFAPPRMDCRRRVPDIDPCLAGTFSIG